MSTVEQLPYQLGAEQLPELAAHGHEPFEAEVNGRARAVMTSLVQFANGHQDYFFAYFEVEDGLHERTHEEFLKLCEVNADMLATKGVQLAAQTIYTARQGSLRQPAGVTDVAQSDPSVITYFLSRD